MFVVTDDFRIFLSLLSHGIMITGVHPVCVPGYRCFYGYASCIFLLSARLCVINFVQKLFLEV